MLDNVITLTKPTRAASQVLWFLLHLGIVYATVYFCMPRLAGLTREIILPLFRHPSYSSRFQFLFSHIVIFSVIPAFFVGLAINAKFKHKIAVFVCFVPALILMYKLVTFPAPSVFEGRFPAAVHQYFGREFLVPEFHDWHELFSVSRSNTDMARGMTQLTFSAPFYAGLAYSMAAWIISASTDVMRKIQAKAKSLIQG